MTEQQYTQPELPAMPAQPAAPTQPASPQGARPTAQELRIADLEQTVARLQRERQEAEAAAWQQRIDEMDPEDYKQWRLNEDRRQEERAAIEQQATERAQAMARAEATRTLIQHGLSQVPESEREGLQARVTAGEFQTPDDFLAEAGRMARQVRQSVAPAPAAPATPAATQENADTRWAKAWQAKVAADRRR